jgi:hypothetical protein
MHYSTDRARDDDTYFEVTSYRVLVHHAETWLPTSVYTDGVIG